MLEETTLKEPYLEAAVKLIREQRDGSLFELMSRINYWETAKNNPTKDKTEILEYLYEELDQLGAFISTGIEDVEISEVRRVFEKAIQINRLIERLKPNFDLLLKKVIENRDKGTIPQDYVFCLALSPNNDQVLVKEIPQKSGTSNP